MRSAKYLMKMDDAMHKWFMATLEDAVPQADANQRERIRAVIRRMGDMQPGQMSIFILIGGEYGQGKDSGVD